MKDYSRIKSSRIFFNISLSVMLCKSKYIKLTALKGVVSSLEKLIWPLSLLNFFIFRWTFFFLFLSSYFVYNLRVRTPKISEIVSFLHSSSHYQSEQGFMFVYGQPNKWFTEFKTNSYQMTMSLKLKFQFDGRIFIVLCLANYSQL